MKLKRIVGSILSVILIVSGANFSFADNSVSNEDVVSVDDEAVSEAAVDVDVVNLASSSTDVAYAVEGGNIYYDPNTGEIKDCDASVTSAVIPSEIYGVKITSIGEDAFKYCSKLTNITIPEGVTSIGEDAFEYCSSLVSMEIPDSVVEIGKFSFRLCEKLKDLKLSENLKIINYSSFSDCISLNQITIPNNVMQIEKYAFAGCTSISQLEIGTGVRIIKEFAFEDCKSLIEVEIPEGVETLEGKVFNRCTELTSLKLPNSINHNINYSILLNGCGGNVKELITPNFMQRGYVQLAWNNLETLIVTKTAIIDWSGFSGHDALRKVVLPSDTEIDYYGFSECKNLESVTLPPGVEINPFAFIGCKNIKELFIGQEAISTSYAWGEYNTQFLPNLAKIYFYDNVYRPSFFDSNNLETIEVDENNKNYSSLNGVLFNKNRDELIRCPVAKKGTYSIPENVTTISEGAFDDCVLMKTIILPKSLTDVGNKPFNGCIELDNIKVNSNNDIYMSINGVLYYKETLSLLRCPQNKSGCYIVPNNTNSIESYAFQSCNKLTKICIGDSVNNIGAKAFSGTSELRTIEVGQGSLHYAWSDVENLEKVILTQDIQSITTCFSGCKNLKNIFIPNTVTRINSFAFGGCSSLTSIEIPSSVTSIYSSVFKNCSSLTSITIPSSITSIGDSAFYNCSGLTSISIPDSVTAIGTNAFQSCNNLTIYCPENSYAETYAKNNNIPYSTEGYVEYTKTEADLPADVGDSIRFEKKVYDFDGELYVGDIPYEFEVRALVKYESMLDNIEITCSDKSVLDVSKINYKGDYISMGDMLGYNYQARYQTTALKNGEVILTATLPNGDSSSCLVRVKCYDMGYDVNNDFTKPNYFETRVTCENSITYDDNGFSKSSLPVTISYGNRRRIDHIYTDEEIANCTVQNLKIDVTLSAGLSFSNDNVNDKTRTFEIGNLGLNEGDTLQLEVYPTSYVSKQLSINVNFKADNIEVDNKGVIVVNSDKILDYNVSASTQEYVNTLSPEARVQFYLDEYYAQVAAYDKTTEGELNRLYKQGLASNSDGIYSNIKDTLDSNLVITYDMLQSDEITEATRRALYQYITEGTDELIGIGKIDITENDVKIGASLVNDIRKSIISETVTETVSFKNASGKTVYYDVTFNVFGYDVTFNVFGIGAFKCDNFKVVNKATNEKFTTATMASSNNQKVSAVMEAYVKQLQNIGIDVVNQGIASAVDFYSDTLGVNKYLKSACLKKLESALPLLKNRNLGEIYTFAQCISKDFDILKNIDPNDLDNCMSSIKSILNTDFTGNTISNQVINQSFTQVKKARNNLIEAFTYYMGYGTMPENFVQKVLKNFFTQCPVDVYVYDSSGNELGSVVDGVIKCDSDIISISTVGESKIVSLLQNEEIKFKIVATDFGSLNVTVEDYSDEGAVIGRTNYYDIPLKIEDEFTTELIAADTENIIIYSSNTEYQYNEKLSSDNDGGVNIDTENLNGKVFGTGRYVKGDYVTLSAVPDEGYLFAGWYNGDEFISGNVTYNLTAKEDLTLVAKFSGIVDNTVVVGDVNGDGNVTTADALVVARLAIGKIQNEELSSVCDFNNDGKITTVDALILARYAIGKISEL